MQACTDRKVTVGLVEAGFAMWKPCGGCYVCGSVQSLWRGTKCVNMEPMIPSRPNPMFGCRAFCNWKEAPQTILRERRNSLPMMMPFSCLSKLARISPITYLGSLHTKYSTLLLRSYCCSL